MSLCWIRIGQIWSKGEEARWKNEKGRRTMALWLQEATNFITSTSKLLITYHLPFLYHCGCLCYHYNCQRVTLMSILHTVTCATAIFLSSQLLPQSIITSVIDHLHANIIHQKHQFHYHWWANLSSSPPSHGSDLIVTPKISMLPQILSLHGWNPLSHIAEIFT